MNVRSSLAALLVFAIAAGCAAIETGPTISPITGEPYPEGTPPRETAETQAVTLLLVQAETADGEAARDAYRRATEQVEVVLEDDPENPRVQYLAGVAFAGVDRFEEADAAFRRAEELYPAYQLEVEPAREGAWIEVFNRGVDAYNRGDLDEAASLWRGATILYPQQPAAFQNLGAIYLEQGREEEALGMFEQMIEGLERPVIRDLEEDEVQAREEARTDAMVTMGQLLVRTGRMEEAERMFRDYLAENPDDVAARSTLGLVLVETGRTDEALQIFQELINDPEIDPQGLFAAGVALFQAEQYDQAAEVFGRLTEITPYNRDAWFNYANALYAGDRWSDLIGVSERLLEIDPANQNAMLIVARAHRELEQNQRALEILEMHEDFPLFLDDLQFSARSDRAVLRGIAEGNAAAAGSTVRVRFHFYDEGGRVGSEDVTITAPAREQTTQFEVVHQTNAQVTGYRYEIL